MGWRKIMRGAAGVALGFICLTSCAIDRTTIEADGPARVDAPIPAVEPTAPPPPTPAFEALPTAPPPTAEALPTPTPEPLPTVDVAVSVDPIPTLPGPIEFDGISFMLADQRLVSRLPGHLLVYLDGDRLAEVDVFTPVASRDGSTFAGYQAVVDFIASNDEFAGLEELAPVTIAGRPTRVFSGTASAVDRSFFTSIDDIENEEYGWFAPARMQLWVIDGPSGTVIVSAEALEDPGQFTDAVRLATEVLSTIEFG